MASKPPEFDPQHMSEQMKQSAQQIWQAGLGAFAKAQQEGGKMYEMGLPNVQDMADLQARVAALEAEVKVLKSGGKG